MLITCGGETASPTTSEPTPTPTFPTFQPTTSEPAGQPSKTPTAPTMNPTTAEPTTSDPTTFPTTASPTIFNGHRESCGSDTWCYYITVGYPGSLIRTETIAITADVSGATYHQVYITSVGTNCVNPNMDILYEEIDFDSSSEYFDIIDNDGNLISRCDGTQQLGCGVWEKCVGEQNLPVSSINASSSYTITIEGSSSLNSLCSSHDYSLNVHMTISCRELTGNYTFSPSTAPTTSPTEFFDECAFYEGATSNAYDIDWHPFDVSITTSLIIDSCDSLYDTWLYFQYLNGTNILNCDDCGDCGLQTILEIKDVPPGHYRIGIGGYDDAYGTYSVKVFCTNRTLNTTTNPWTTRAPTTTHTSSSRTTSHSSATTASPHILHSTNSPSTADATFYLTLINTSDSPTVGIPTAPPSSLITPTSPSTGNPTSSVPTTLPFTSAIPTIIDVSATSQTTNPVLPITTSSIFPQNASTVGTTLNPTNEPTTQTPTRSVITTSSASTFPTTMLSTATISATNVSAIPATTEPLVAITQSSISPPNASTTVPTLNPTLEPTTKIPTTSMMTTSSALPNSSQTTGATTSTLHPSQDPTTTSYPTTDNAYRKFFIVTLDGNFDAVHQYTDKNIHSFVLWANKVIDVLMKVNDYPILKNMITYVFSIKKGSIIMDLGIEADNQYLLDLATTNINKTAMIDGVIYVDDNFTFPIIELEFHALDRIINGLRVYCYFDNDCQDSIIICPPIGCDITCGAPYSCSGASIVYSGSHQDGGKVKIECTNNYACYNLNVSANNADNIEIHCTTEHDDYTCYYAKIYANYANSVNLYGVNDNGYGFYYSEIYCNSALSVSLFARGTFAFYQSTLYAENVESVSIDCISGKDDIACYLSNFYLPSANPYTRAFINCYGKGCYFMGTSFVKDTVNDLAMSVNSCGQCDDIEDCLGLISFRCDGNYSTYESWHGSHETSCDSCGCDDFINGITFKNIASHSECYVDGSDVYEENSSLPASEGLSSTTTSTNLTVKLTGLFAFLAGMVLCCCGGVVYYFVHRKKEKKRKRRAQIDKSAKSKPYFGPNIEVTELNAVGYSVAETKEEAHEDEIAEDGLDYTVPLKQDEDDGNDMNETAKLPLNAVEEDDGIAEKVLELALSDDDDQDRLYKE